MTKDTFYWFLRVRPTTITSCLRLGIAFASALLFKITGLKRMAPGYPIPGIFVPGHGTLDVKVENMKVTVRPADISLIVGTHEPETTSWYSPRPGQTIIDVGAHIGRYALLGARNHAKLVVAIEPDNQNFVLLKKNIAANRFSIVAKNVALSDKPGRRSLYLNNGMNTGTSSLEETWNKKLDSDGIPAQSVECTTLDGICEKMGLDIIDWLKIDVEGHEVHVLEGGKNTLARTNHLIIEVTSINHERCLELIEEAGLKQRSVEQGRVVSNWLCIRGGLNA